MLEPHCLLPIHTCFCSILRDSLNIWTLSAASRIQRVDGWKDPENMIQLNLWFLISVSLWSVQNLPIFYVNGWQRITQFYCKKAVNNYYLPSNNNLTRQMNATYQKMTKLYLQMSPTRCQINSFLKIQSIFFFIIIILSVLTIMW